MEIAASEAPGTALLSSSASQKEQHHNIWLPVILQAHLSASKPLEMRMYLTCQSGELGSEF